MIKKILTFLASIYCSALLLNYTEKYITAQNKETVKPKLMPHYSLFLLFYIAFMIIALL